MESIRPISTRSKRSGVEPAKERISSLTTVTRGSSRILREYRWKKGTSSKHVNQVRIGLDDPDVARPLVQGGEDAGCCLRA